MADFQNLCRLLLPFNCLLMRATGNGAETETFANRLPVIAKATPKPKKRQLPPT